MSVRTEVADLFREDWRDIPELSRIDVVATEKALEIISTDTALIRQKSIRREPTAPLSHRRVGLLLTIISAHEDLDRAGDELDEILPAVLTYLDTRFQYESATAVGYADRLAYDIELTTIAANKES